MNARLQGMLPAATISQRRHRLEATAGVISIAGYTGRKRSDPVSIAEYPAERSLTNTDDTVANTRDGAARAADHSGRPRPKAVEM